jgi:catechol 2,3-dioxygenase-like lactoylglutathione lyase family enzyme
MLQLTHFGLWVRDQDEAYDFYVNKLGFTVGEDATLDGGFRWLTVSPPSQPEIEIMLLKPGPPPLDPGTAAEVAALVARGALPGAIFAVDDCRAAYEELRARGVEFHEEPTERFYGTDAAFRDPSGNPIRITQRAPRPVPAR